MEIINYNKLVRDKIPEIIKNNGGTHFTETLSDEEYIEMLNQKLLEEVNEYLESRGGFENKILLKKVVEN